MQPFPVKRARRDHGIKVVIQRNDAPDAAIVKFLNECIEQSADRRLKWLTVIYKNETLEVSSIYIHYDDFKVVNYYFDDLRRLIQHVYEREYFVWVESSENKITIDWSEPTPKGPMDLLHRICGDRGKIIRAEAAIELYRILRYKPLKWIHDDLLTRGESEAYDTMKTHLHDITIRTIYCGIPTLFGTRLPVELIRIVHGYL